MRSIRFSSMPLLLILAFALAILSCNKPAAFFNTDTGDQNRKAVVKIKDGGDILVIALDAVPTIETFLLIEISRDPNSETDLNQPLTVKLKKDLALITAYNTANGASLVELPAGVFTLSEDPTNLTFQPGETTKQINITLNKTTLDLSNQYALAYSFVEVGSGAVVSSTANFGLYAIIIKNKYDGHYEVTGTMVDYSNAALTGDYPFECDLETTGPNSVIMYNYTGAFVGYFHPILSAGASSAYGSFVPEFIFNATDNVSQVVNGYGQPSGNGRSAELDPSGLNKWNPATKGIDVKYWMNQPAVFTPHRTSFAENFKYLRPR